MSRRSAIFASLNWQHGDIQDFIRAKDWTEEQRELKDRDFNFPLPLDMTNISINWDTDFINMIRDHNEMCEFTLLPEKLPKLWYDSIARMCKTGEPGHCYNLLS